MRIDFLEHMMKTGYSECNYCGKMISPSNTINGLCPDCAMKNE